MPRKTRRIITINMNRLTLFVLLLGVVSLPGRTMAVNNYEGLYRIFQLFDDEMGEIPLPANSEYKVNMQLDSREGALPNTYNLGMHIGNSMGGFVTVSESDEEGKDACKIGPLRSTMMMPPEDVFRVEMALSDILPASTFIHLEQNNDLLVIEGPKGQMHCTRLS